MQDQYGQGQMNRPNNRAISLGQWLSGNKFSWGPKLDTCALDKTNWNNYEWKDFDVDGRIVSNKTGTSGSVNAYNPYSFFQTGITTDNSLSLSGGSDISTFYFSFSDNQTKGIVPNNTLRRNTFKISGDTKLSEHFKVSGTANYIITAANRIQQGNNTSGLCSKFQNTSYIRQAAGYVFPSDYLLPIGFNRCPSTGK